MTLLEAPEPPLRLASNSLLADSVARLVSAATVEAALGTLAVELEALPGFAAALAAVAAITLFSAEAALDALKRLDRAEAWLPTLPIDIRSTLAAAGTRIIGRDSKNLRRILRRRCVVFGEACVARRSTARRVAQSRERPRRYVLRPASMCACMTLCAHIGSCNSMAWTSSRCCSALRCSSLGEY